MAVMSLYFSRIQGNRIYLHDLTPYGSLMDLGVSMESKNPIVKLAKVKTSSGIKYIDWRCFTITKEHGQYVLKMNKPLEVNFDGHTTLLAKYVLDKQIVDINGRKVVRVNDIRLVLLNTGLFVVGVDIGMEGLLRRLGLAKPIKIIMGNKGKNISSKLILWNDVQAIIPSNDNIKLSKSYTKLYTMHPSDLADIIEDFDSRTGMAIFNSLDYAKAADVLEELESNAQVNILKTLSTEKAADILEEMPADEVADILDDLNDEKAEDLLNNMEKGASSEVRELMEYPDNAVGSLMSTEILSFKNTQTVDDAINILRKLKPEADNIYNLYVTDEKNSLIGIIPLRDLVISQPETTLQNIMTNDFISVYDTDTIDTLVKAVSKYNLLSVPVVDKDMVLLGTVIINDIVYELLKSRKRA